MFSTTTMSQNGQVVIPSSIRKAAKLKPKEQFTVYQKGDTILLKKVDEDTLSKELEASLRRAIEDVRKGRVYTLDMNKTDEKLIRELCASDTPRSSRKNSKN